MKTKMNPIRYIPQLAAELVIAIEVDGTEAMLKRIDLIIQKCSDELSGWYLSPASRELAQRKGLEIMELKILSSKLAANRLENDGLNLDLFKNIMLCELQMVDAGPIMLFLQTIIHTRKKYDESISLTLNEMIAFKSALSEAIEDRLDFVPQATKYQNELAALDLKKCSLNNEIELLEKRLMCVEPAELLTIPKSDLEAAKSYVKEVFAMYLYEARVKKEKIAEREDIFSKSKPVTAAKNNEEENKLAELKYDELKKARLAEIDQCKQDRSSKGEEKKNLTMRLNRFFSTASQRVTTKAAETQTISPKTVSPKIER